MDAIYAHAHFDDLDHDTRSQWVAVSKGTNQLCMMSATKPAISIKLIATTVSHFYVTLLLQTFVIWLGHLVYVCAAYASIYGTVISLSAFI